VSVRRFAGQIALVTGASRGIGAAIAEALAAEGAHVILAARTQGGLEEVEGRIFSAGGAATIAPLDLTDGDQIDRLCQVIAERWSKLDVLVLNAALLGALTPLPHMEPADFERIFTTNVTANFRLLRICDPLLRASSAGRVVALTSSVAVTPRAFWGPYAASKAALETLVASYAEEVANISPVRCLSVDPGRTRSKMRASAYPGEDVETLPLPAQKSSQIIDLIDKTNILYTRHTLT
jgi:NAD(P)-dependent dehydrogenase (short-subunit alcohol dehydrogenase family)